MSFFIYFLCEMLCERRTTVTLPFTRNARAVSGTSHRETYGPDRVDLTDHGYIYMPRKIYRSCHILISSLMCEVYPPPPVSVDILCAPILFCTMVSLLLCPWPCNRHVTGVKPSFIFHPVPRLSFNVQARETAM